jgi:hypothetical protein
MAFFKVSGEVGGETARQPVPEQAPQVQAVAASGTVSRVERRSPNRPWTGPKAKPAKSELKPMPKQKVAAGGGADSDWEEF